MDCKDCVHYEVCYMTNRPGGQKDEVCDRFTDFEKIAVVVRCKSCVHSDYPGERIVWCKLNRKYTPFNGYCNYGKERGVALQAVISAAMTRDDYLTNPCIGALTKVPNADVVEVRHGEWKYNPDTDFYYCSECCNSDSSFCKYCSNCGAKMDGKGDS